MTVRVGDTVKCPNCDGAGYKLTSGFDGLKRPKICRACNGDGKLPVRP